MNTVLMPLPNTPMYLETCCSSSDDYFRMIMSRWSSWAGAIFDQRLRFEIDRRGSGPSGWSRKDMDEVINCAFQTAVAALSREVLTSQIPPSLKARPVDF